MTTKRASDRSKAKSRSSRRSESQPTKRNPGGRPTKKLPEAVKLLLDTLRDGAPISTACDIAGIDRQTFYNWIDKDAAFSAMARGARAFAVMHLIKLQRIKDPWKLLRSIDPENFKDETPEAPRPPRDPALIQIPTKDLVELHIAIKSGKIAGLLPAKSGD